MIAQNQQQAVDFTSGKLYKLLFGFEFRQRPTCVANMNHQYQIIIYWSKEDESFIAEVPELPGCMSDGASQAEALQNVQAIIEEWIETAKGLGRSIPEPKDKLMFA